MATNRQVLAGLLLVTLAPLKGFTATSGVLLRKRGDGVVQGLGGTVLEVVQVQGQLRDEGNGQGPAAEGLGEIDGQILHDGGTQLLRPDQVEQIASAPPYRRG